MTKSDILYLNESIFILALTPQSKAVKAQAWLSGLTALCFYSHNAGEGW